MKRVYHPTNDAFQDVPEGDVDKWAKAGWLKGRPSKHSVDESERPEVGSFVPVDVPREPAFIEPEPSSATPAPKAEKADSK